MNKGQNNETFDKSLNDFGVNVLEARKPQKSDLNFQSR